MGMCFLLQVHMTNDTLIVQLDHGCQTQGPRAESGLPRHFMWPPDGLKDVRSPFLQEIQEKKHPVLLF